MLPAATTSAVMLGMRLPKSLSGSSSKVMYDEPPVAGRIARALVHLDHGVGRLGLGAEVQPVDVLAVAEALALDRGLGEVDDQLAVGPDPADGIDRALGERHGEGREVGIGDDRLPAAAFAGARLAALLDQRPCPDHVAGDAHGPEHLRDAHAVGRGLDLEVAEAGSLDLLLLPAGEQRGADEGADQPADLGRAKEGADGSAGGGDSELGHGSVGLLEAVGGDDAPEPLRIGAVLDAGAGIGVGVDQGEGLAPVADDRDVLRVAGEAHQQDVARRRLGNRLGNEMLLAERAELLAVGDAAVGAGVEVEQAELLARRRGSARRSPRRRP